MPSIGFVSFSHYNYSKLHHNFMGTVNIKNYVCTYLYVCVCSNITLEFLKQFQPNLIHLWFKIWQPTHTADESHSVGWKLLFHLLSSSSFCSSDVYRCESGRCCSLPFFLIYFSLLLKSGRILWGRYPRSVDGNGQ